MTAYGHSFFGMMKNDPKLTVVIVATISVNTKTH